MARAKRAHDDTTTNLGFEAKLWAAADALRNNMDAAEYKHVVLGLIFLKYISDAFEAKHAELAAQKAEGADPEDPDESRAASIFWVPKEARWSHLRASAPQPTIGKLVDDAMAARSAWRGVDVYGRNSLKFRQLVGCRWIRLDTLGCYSAFCTCSRICSMRTFMSTAVRVVSRSWDFEESVLASRLSSCMRKSSRRPAGSPPAITRRTSAM